MFVSGNFLLSKASSKGYALPAFNTGNLEVSMALFSASEKLRAPLFIQVTEATIAYAGLENIFSIVKQLEKNASVPVCIHLDHGRDFSIIKKCIGFGFKSVMVDASKFSLKKNIALTKKVVLIAKRKNCSVEAEIGALKGPGSDKLTVPKEAKFFVEKTKCDSLAIAIGTSHGAHKFSGKPELDFERLKEIQELVSIPLVLHGASSVPPALVQKCNRFGAKISNAKGVPESNLRKAIKMGIAKINIDTDLRLAFTAGLREFHAKNPKDFDPRNALVHAREIVQQTAEHKIKLFGSKGKAI